MKRVFVWVCLVFMLFSGCASSNGLVKKEPGVGDFLKFSLDLVSLGLLLGGSGNPAHIPSASLGTALDFGKAADYVLDHRSSDNGVSEANPESSFGY
jgi:hypothetical protein